MQHFSYGRLSYIKLAIEFIRSHVKGFIEAYDIKSTDDIKNTLTDLIGGTVETMMQAEFDEDLGYTKHDSENKMTDNSRNSASPKTLHSEYGKVKIDVPT